MSIPSIKDQIMTPADKFVGVDGKDVNTLLVPDGVAVDKTKFPKLWKDLGGRDGDALWSNVEQLFECNEAPSNRLLNYKDNLQFMEWQAHTQGSYSVVDAGVYGSAIQMEGSAMATSPYYSTRFSNLGSFSYHPFDQDGTLEITLRVDATTEKQMIYNERYSAGSTLLGWGLCVNTNLTWGWWFDSSMQLLADTKLSLDNFEEICIERVASTGMTTLYLNGVTVAQGVTSYVYSGSTQTLGVTYEGRIDSTIAQLRLTRGIRHGKDYTPEGRYLLVPNNPNVPDLTDKDSSCPYKVVADLYRYKIGDEIRSNKDKYQENGVDKYDALVQDGSAVDKATHPKLWELAELNYLATVNAYKLESATYITCSDDGLTIYQSSYSMGVAKSVDGGQTWVVISSITHPTNTFRSQGVACSSDGQILYIATTRDIQVSNNGGGTFQVFNTLDCHGLACSSDGSIVYGSDWAALYKIEGTAVLTHSECISAYLSCSADGSTVFAKESNGDVTAYDSYGTTKRVITSGGGSCPLPFNSSSAYLTTSTGGLQVTYNNGVSLTALNGHSIAQSITQGASNKDGSRFYIFRATAGNLDTVVIGKQLPNKPTTDNKAPYRIIGDLT